MIKMNHNPFEGSALNLTLAFRDKFGHYYVPLVVTYTLLALNNDKESWQVVDELYKKSIVPSSYVKLTVPKMKLVDGTTLARKVIFEWSALVDGEITEFVDEVNFEIQPQPYITNKPDEPEPTTIYVEVSDIVLQTGSSVSAPILPVLICSTNLPVKLDDCSVVFNKSDTESVESTTSIDSTNTKLTVTPNTALDYGTSYTLKISGLKSTVNNYEMKEAFEYNFKTVVAGEITLESLKADYDALELRVKALEEKG